MTPKSKYYFYKLMVDSGGAPCIYRNVLSLAICKPAIRSTCNIGDWIIGVGSKTNHDERLIYIAQVTKKYKNGRYYEIEQYKSRPDCIYRWDRKNELVWRKGSRFHEGGYEPDIGQFPNYDKANVLISNNFRYFGQLGSDDYKKKYPAFGIAIKKLTQGHRVNHTQQLESSIQRIIQSAWRRYDLRKIGEPSDGDSSRNCSQVESSQIGCICSNE